MFCVACVWMIVVFIKIDKTCVLIMNHDNVLYGNGSVSRARGSLFWKPKFWLTLYLPKYRE
jgi:hypothetical protein